MPKLFVICGHGEGDPGACGNDFQEAERVRALASRIAHFGGSNVVIGDTSKNWYSRSMVNASYIPKDMAVCELHMDCSTSTSAKGAHVIIKGGCEPDSYDYALANFLSILFSGRSESIVGKNNLKNVNSAYRAGLNYRLIEIGFISNADDVKKFNSNLDDIAKGILACFGIGASKQTPSMKILDGKTTVSDSNTQMIFEKVDGKEDVYRIKCAENGYYMTASSSKLNAKVDFRNFACGLYQEWQIIKKSWKLADYTMFAPVVAPDLLLSVAESDGSLKLYTDLKSGKQKFYIKDGATALIVSDVGLKKVCC